MSKTLVSFFYDELDPETHAFVQQKTDEIHGQLKRTAEGIIRIGHNLQAVKECLHTQYGHGHYVAWLQSEFEMSVSIALKFTQVAQRFGNKNVNFTFLSVSVLYELAAPSTSEAVVESVLTGEIPSTLQAVRACRSASLAERQARTEQEALQQLLEQERSSTQQYIATLTSKIEQLQGELARLSTPSVKEVPVIPPEVTRQAEALRANVQTLTRQRDTLSARVEELSAQVRASAMGHNEEDAARRLRLAWQTTSNAFQSAVLKVLAQWPAPLDTLAFEAPDWNRVEQVKALCQRVIEQCQRMREAPTVTIVDADEPSERWRDSH